MICKSYCFSYRFGSIIVDYTVVYGDIGSADAVNLTKAVLELEKGTQVTLYGETVNVLSSKLPSSVIICLVLVVRRTNTVKFIWRLLSFYWWRKPLCAIFQARRAPE